MGFLGTFLASGSFVLAKESYAHFCSGAFKGAARRAGWMSRRSWTGYSPIRDAYYDFTGGLSMEHLDVLNRFLARRKGKIEPVDLLCDLLFIEARRIHLGTENNQKDLNFHEFQELASRLLSLLDSRRSSLGPRPMAGAPRTGDFSRLNARQALREFFERFPMHRLRWYVISGTFLGLIRERGFLKHDYDIDLGVHATEFSFDEFISAINTSKQFVVKKIEYQDQFHQGDSGSSRVDRVLAIVQLVHRNGVSIDLFVHYTENDVCWHGSAMHRWENTTFDLKSYDFEGIQVLGPSDAERYLEENYGDWRTPVTDFNCGTGTPNLRLVRNFSSIALFLRILASAGDLETFLKVERSLVDAGYVTNEAKFSLAPITAHL